jgi:hypothetical protein
MDLEVINGQSLSPFMACAFSAKEGRRPDFSADFEDMIPFLASRE